MEQKNLPSKINRVLFKWNTRLNSMEYNEQLSVSRKRGKNRLKTFNPHWLSELFVEKQIALLSGKITVEQAMQFLWSVDVRTEINKCIKGGF